MAEVKPCKRGHTSERYPAGGCRECLKITTDAWNARNRAHVRARNATWMRENPKTRWRERGIILESIPERPILGECEACGYIPLTLSCDHDHETGLFRGWLCSDCNLALGNAHDSVEKLEGLIKYLRSKTK